MEEELALSVLCEQKKTYMFNYKHVFCPVLEFVVLSVHVQVTNIHTGV